MLDEGEKGYNVFRSCFNAAGADACVIEVGAKGSEPDHAVEVYDGSVVEVWIKNVSAKGRLHDSGCKAV